MSFPKCLLFNLLLLFFFSATAQQEQKSGVFEMVEKDHTSKDSIDAPTFKTNFDHWAYSEKKHAILFYGAPMFQYGFNGDTSTYQLHHDLGIFYRWFMVDKEGLKINFQAWAEQNSQWTGSSSKQFSKDLKMISSVNGSDVDSFSVSIEYFYLEFFLFNEKWDISIGKFDPLFLTTFTNYAGWDKYNYFAKSSASDPVPPLNPGMGIFSEYHFSDNFSIGGIITDDQPHNDFLYIPNFGTTTWAYEAFINFKLGTSKGLYSEHHLSFYYVDEKKGEAKGQGFTYTANQGLNEKLILVLKISNGQNRILKLNSAYVLGLTFKNPLGRAHDYFGVAAILNEKEKKYEFGIDTFWKFQMAEWFSFSPNIQAYYSVNDQVNIIPGIRAFFAY